MALLQRFTRFTLSCWWVWSNNNLIGSSILFCGHRPNLNQTNPTDGATGRYVILRLQRFGSGAPGETEGSEHQGGAGQFTGAGGAGNNKTLVKPHWERVAEPGVCWHAGGQDGSLAHSHWILTLQRCKKLRYVKHKKENIVIIFAYQHSLNLVHYRWTGGLVIAIWYGPNLH